MEEMMEIKTTVEASPTAAVPDPGMRESLPPMVVGGDGAPVERTHGLPTWLYIGFCYLVAAGAAFIPLNAVYEGTVEELRSPLLVVAGPVIAVLHLRLAGEVRRFASWGWYGAMIELVCFAMFQIGLAMDGGGGWADGLLEAIVPSVWVWYFWRRRDQFDVDIGG
jgi:hypothetical protein